MRIKEVKATNKEKEKEQKIVEKEKKKTAKN